MYVVIHFCDSMWSFEWKRICAGFLFIVCLYLYCLKAQSLVLISKQTLKQNFEYSQTFVVHLWFRFRNKVTKCKSYYKVIFGIMYVVIHFCDSMWSFEWKRICAGFLFIVCLYLYCLWKSNNQERASH
jgi:hypothetical protein